MIRTYANTKAELNMEEKRLDLLLERKERLYVKYFRSTSKYDEVSAHTNKKTDPFADYMTELTKINEITGMSLDDEIQEKRNEVDLLRYYIRIMDDILKKTTGRVNELFKLIVQEGFGKTKAVQKIAEKYRKTPETIWKYDYSQIEDDIKKIEGN